MTSRAARGDSFHARVATHAVRQDGTRKPDPIPGFLFTEVLIVLSAAAPLLLCLVTPTPSSSSWVLACAVVVGAGARYSWLVGVGDPRLVEMTIWLFVYVFLGVAPLVQLRLETSPETTPGLRAEFLEPGLWVAAIGALAIAAGSQFAAHRSRDVEPTSPRLVRRGRALLLAAGSLLIAAYWVVRVGSTNLFTSRFELSKATAAAFPDPTTRAVVGAAAMMSLLVAFVALMQLRRQEREAGRPGPLLLILVVFTALFVVANPISNARYAFGTVALGVLAALGLYSTKWRFRMVALAAVAALLLAFPSAGTARVSGLSGARAVGPIEGLTGGDFDSFAQIVNAVTYVHYKGIEWGWQALGVVFFWVPRSIWEAKPVDTGILLAQSRNYRFTNLSAPLWAELLINGGWVLLIVGMVALGWFARRADARIVATSKRQPVPGVLACIVPGYLLIVLRGSLLQSVANLAVIVACALFVLEPRRRAKGNSGQV